MNKEELRLIELVKNEPFYIRDAKQTPELCLMAVKAHPYAVIYVEKELLTLEMIIEAIKIEPKTFKFVEQRYNFTQTEYDQLVDISPQVLRYIDEQFMNYKMCMKALKKDNGCYWFLPDRLKLRKNISYYAIKSSFKNIAVFPMAQFSKYLNEEVCLWLLKNSTNGYKGLSFFPSSLMTRKIAEFTVINDSHNLKYVPKEMQTASMCLKALQSSVLNQRFIKIVPNASDVHHKELEKKLVEMSKQEIILETL